jgi:hypothetical protein
MVLPARLKRRPQRRAVRGSRWLVVGALVTIIAFVVFFPRAGLVFAVVVATITLVATAAARRRRVRSPSRDQVR